MKKQILMLFAIFAFSFSANAMVEVRAGYGLMSPDVQSGTDFDAFTGFNIDILASLPVVPFGFGLRYESFASEIANSGGIGSDFTRTSVLVNYRFIDNFVYLGAIGSIGIVNSFELDPIPGFLPQGAKWDKGLTYSVGLEGGVDLGLIGLGAELGYLLGTLESDTAGLSDVEMDAVYTKVIVGIGF